MTRSRTTVKLLEVSRRAPIRKMRSELILDHLLTPEDRQAIDDLFAAVYPPGMTADWAGASVEWARQTIRALARDDGRIICHVGALVRSALIDGRPIRIGGIGGVMTAPEMRGHGFARAALAAMRRHLVVDRQVSFSLLFCAADLYGFYGQLGWRLFAGRALVTQRGATVEFTLDRAMVQGGLLDLCGAPW